MKKAPVPDNDDARVKSLENMGLLSTAREGDLDRITRTAQKVFDTDIALISLVDKDRQWFKARVGLDAQETGRDISFCGHAIMEEEAFVVDDPLNDDRFHDNPLVTGGPEIRFYAGQPLTNSEGHRIGTLCVIAGEQKEFADGDRQTLRDLGRMVEVILENRQLSDSQQIMMQALGSDERDSLIDAETSLWNERGFDEIFERELKRAKQSHMPFSVALCSCDGQASEAASILVDQTKTSEYVFRLGEHMFAILLPEVGMEGLRDRAEKYFCAFERRADGRTYGFGWDVVDTSLDVGNFKSAVLEQCRNALMEAMDSPDQKMVIKDFQMEIINSL